MTGSLVRKLWHHSLGAWVLTVLLSTATLAQEGDARKILKEMSDFVGSQKSLMVAYDTDVEVVTLDYQKIQFASSGKVLLSRPDKLRFSRTGGYVDIDVTYDGNTITVLGKDENAYAQWSSSGSVDQIVARLRDEFGISAPGADLLATAPLDQRSLFSTAEARIGRPATPMSYAGVARRTARLAVAVGAAAGAARYYGSACVQRVDAYGRVYSTC